VSSAPAFVAGWAVPDGTEGKRTRVGLPRAARRVARVRVHFPAHMAGKCTESDALARSRSPAHSLSMPPAGAPTALHSPDTTAPAAK
jgi:hypothetical protein